MLYLKLGVSLALLALLAWAVDWREAALVLFNAHPGWIAAALLANLSGLLLSSYKWQCLVKARGLALPYLQALRAYWMGSFASNWLPSTVGGDVVRLAAVHRVGPLPVLTASVVVERVTGFAVLIAVCTLILIAQPSAFADPKALLVLWACLVVGAVASLATLVAPSLTLRVLDGWEWPKTGWWANTVDWLRSLAQAKSAFAREPGALAKALLLSVPFYGCTVATQYAVLHAVGGPLPLFEVAMIAPLLPLIGLIPLSLNGLGWMEGAFVLFYTAAGVPAEAALAGAVLRRLVTLTVSTGGALFWLTPGPSARTA